MRLFNPHKKRSSALVKTLIFGLFVAILFPSTVIGAGGPETFDTDGGSEYCDTSVSPPRCGFDTPEACGSAPSCQSSISPKAADTERNEALQNQSATGDDLVPLWARILGMPLFAALAFIAFLVFKVAGFFLHSMAKILDFAIDTTINSNLLKSLDFVDLGWTAVRDFSNMFFIFALLYIAIQTILGLAGGGTKRWIAHLIIAAILINFSLFATKVVIDSGNILGTSFWNKIKVQQGTELKNSASAKILGGLDLQTVFGESGQTGLFGSMSFPKQAIAYAGGAVFMFIAGYVLLAGALMMVTRTIMLVILMIFSPFAFMSFGFPKLEQYGHQWLGKLIKQTFVAPFFIFMLYLNSVMVDHLDIFKLSQSKNTDFLDAVTGGGEFQIIFNFAMMIGFMIASIAIANSFAGDVGSHARGWAKSASKWAGGMATGAAVGTGAFAMRQGLGKIGMVGKENKQLHEMAAKQGWRGMVGRGAIAVSSGMARATYDPRATKWGAKALSGGGRIDIGQAGGKGGREATGSILGTTPLIELLNKGDVGTDRAKEVLELAERRYKNDPKGRAAFLEANLGTMVKDGKRVNRYLNDSEYKTMREGITTQERTQAAKEVVKSQPQVIRDKKAELAALKERKATKEEITASENGLKEATTKLADAVNKLSGKEFAEMVTKDMLIDPRTNAVKPELVNAMGRQHVAYLNANPEVYDQETRAAITNEGMLNGRPEFRQYAIQQAKMGTAQLPIDLKEEMRKRVEKYDAELRSLQALPDNESRREAMEKLNMEHDDAVQDILGGMKPKDVARMDDTIKSHRTLVRNYATKHFDEIEKYHKTIKKDVAEKRQLFADIRANVKGSKSAEKYMSNAKSGSVYFVDVADTPAYAETEARLRQAQAATEAAKASLDTAQATARPGEIDDAEKASAAGEAHRAAIDNEKRVREELERMKNEQRNRTDESEEPDDERVDEYGNPIT